jgi:hypothetical protein
VHRPLGDTEPVGDLLPGPQIVIPASAATRRALTWLAPVLAAPRPLKKIQPAISEHSAFF